MSVLGPGPPLQGHALPSCVAPLVLCTGEASAIRAGICGGDFQAVFDLVAMQASPHGFAPVPRQRFPGRLTRGAVRDAILAILRWAAPRFRSKSKMQLLGFYNSSTSYRVRIALALKGIAHEIRPVNIRAREHHSAEYEALNPSRNVPTLVDGSMTLGQSLAIIDYLDTKFPTPRLIPEDPELRAHVLEFVLLIACDIHPLNNLRVLRYLKSKIGANDAQRDAWYAHWIAEGFASAEQLLQRHGGSPFAFGAQPTLADCCLVPQVANALRTGCPTEEFERLMAVYRYCTRLPTFELAAPNRQPDFVE